MYCTPKFVNNLRAQSQLLVAYRSVIFGPPRYEFRDSFSSPFLLRLSPTTGTLISFVSVWPKLGMRSVLVREKDCIVVSPSPLPSPSLPSSLLSVPSPLQFFSLHRVLALSPLLHPLWLYTSPHTHTYIQGHDTCEYTALDRIRSHILTHYTRACTYARERERAY